MARYNTRLQARLQANKVESTPVPQQERSWQQELFARSKEVIAKGLVRSGLALNSVQLQAEIDSIIAQSVPHAEQRYVVPIDTYPVKSSAEQERSPQPFWTLKYTRLSDQANLKDQATLNAAIIEHEKRCDNDM